MTAKDRAAGWCVATSVLLVYLTACGGKAAPQATTPQPQPQPTAGAGQPLPEGYHQRVTYAGQRLSTPRDERIPVGRLNAYLRPLRS